MVTNQSPPRSLHRFSEVPPEVPPDLRIQIWAEAARVDVRIFEVHWDRLIGFTFHFSPPSLPSNNVPERWNPIAKELNVLGLPGALVPGRQIKIRGLNVPRQSGTSKRRVEHKSSLLLRQKKLAVFPQSTPTPRPRLLLHTPTPNPLRGDKSPFASGLKFSLKRL
jgi:hypothetical protein